MKARPHPFLAYVTGVATRRDPPPPPLPPPDKRRSNNGWLSLSLSLFLSLSARGLRVASGSEPKIEDSPR